MREKIRRMKSVAFVDALSAFLSTFYGDLTNDEKRNNRSLVFGLQHRLADFRGHCSPAMSHKGRRLQGQGERASSDGVPLHSETK
jgi:hypothetical protein